MTGNAATPPASTFVVRFWREGSADGPRWRGQVDHVQSGETARFLDLEGLVVFIHSLGIMDRQAIQPGDVNGSEYPRPRGAHLSGAEGNALTD
jgi:hypothetical protein